MIHRVYEQAQKAGLGDIVIACDGEEIAVEAKKIGAKFVITDPNLPSGTDRIYAAFKALEQDFDVIINLQGDLPNIDPKVIQAAAKAAEPGVAFAVIQQFVQRHFLQRPQVRIRCPFTTIQSP